MADCALVAASCARPRSFVIRAVPKPPLYSLLEGTLGRTPGHNNSKIFIIFIYLFFNPPGHGLYVSTGQQRPVAEPMMLASSLGSRPSLQGDIVSVRKLWEMEQFYSNLGQSGTNLFQD